MPIGAALTDSLEAIATRLKGLNDLMAELRADRRRAPSERVRPAWPDNMPVHHPDTTGSHMRVVTPKGRFPMPILTPDGWQDARVIGSVSVEPTDSTRESE
jgi:hypothetical protein